MSGLGDLTREQLIISLEAANHTALDDAVELTELRDLIDGLAELYPGEVPTNEQILAWVKEIKEKAWQYDSLCH
jgi:hypothetical protein